MADTNQIPGAPGQTAPQPQAGPVPAQAPGAPYPLPPVPPPDPPAPNVQATQAYDYLVTSRQFHKDAAAFQANANLKTGFLNLDAVQPFYPGLYCVGAIPGLGKTSLMLQMCDQIAASGRYVLYFSLEQVPFELTSKSLARGFFRTYLDLVSNRPDPAKLPDYPRPSSIDIRRGKIRGNGQELDQEIIRYAQAVENRVIIVTNLFSLTAEDIVATTENVVNQLGGAKPVVIVDYLQIVAPTIINNRVPDTKTALDHTVHTLKGMQADLGLTVVAVSSLNRQNYLTPIAFESFKESGGLEYTADVLWGLELSLMHSKRFYTNFGEDGSVGRDTSLKQKRDMIRKAKTAYPRKVDLVCLKNRYGRASYRAQFHYFPSHDYFEPYFDPRSFGCDPDDPDDDLVRPPASITIPRPTADILNIAAVAEGNAIRDAALTGSPKDLEGTPPVPDPDDDKPDLPGGGETDRPDAEGE